MKRRRFILVSMFLVLMAGTVRAEVQIPKQSDWADRGIALQSGPPGSWEVRLSGISPCTVVKKDKTYYLYYIGADGNRSTDGGPRHRALGVAISTDGIKFTKYAGNPIITHLPHNNEEEGVFSAGAALDENGNVVLYYAALDAGSSTSTSVDSDVRLAVSINGFDFKDVRDVLSHADSSVWGYGDELFPVGSFHAHGMWYVYYIAKGKGAKWDLGLAWGSRPDSLPNTQVALAAGSEIIGGGDPVWLGPDKIGSLIVRDFSSWVMEVRTAFTSLPSRLKLTKTYTFPRPGRGMHSTWFLDKEANTWFMYYRVNGNEIRVKTAPLIDSNAPPRPDTTPPAMRTN